MSAPGKRWFSRLRREPVVVFALGGGLLFLALHPHLPWGAEMIRIDARTAAGILERRADREGRALTAQERERALADYVRDEILVREAYRHGWHREDGRVRQRLVVAMRTLLDEPVSEPSPEELRSYYEDHAGRYRVPESVSFSHVFFENEAPPDTLRALERGVDFRDLGEPFWLGARTSRQTKHQLEGALGSRFAEAVFAGETGLWSGPITSNRGRHFVRVDARHPPELPPLEAMRRFVRVDWESERRSEIRERQMGELRAGFTIVDR